MSDEGDRTLTDADMQNRQTKSTANSPIVRLIPPREPSEDINEPTNTQPLPKINIVGQYEFVPPVDNWIPPLLTDSPIWEKIDRGPGTPAFNIKTTRDALTFGKDNLVHFISADCLMKTDVGLALIDLDLVDSDRLKECKPKKGQVIVSKIGGIFIFSIVIKNRYFDQPTPEDLYHAIASLRIALERTHVSTIRISKVGDGLDRLPSNTLRNMLRSLFANRDITFTLCTGEVKIPPLDQRKQIIHEYQSSVTGGHKGVTKTYKSIRNRFLWPEMKRDIQDFIRRCRSCQQQKLVRIKTRQPMIIPDTPADAFDKVSIDLVGPLRLTPDGHRYVLTMQDNLTKYCLAEAIPNKQAITVADVVAGQLIPRFGCPRAILSDRGGEFINQTLRNLASIFRLKHLTTSGYHPQTNGGLERSHQVLSDYLKHYMEQYED